jgi:hypothetical protein
MFVALEDPGRDHPVGIIPLRRARSSRYGGRLQSESAGMATLFPGIAKFLSKSSEFSARVFTVVLCMITTDTQGISAMTTSLERTLAAHLAECLELDAACRRVFQAAAALRTDNKRSVLAVKRTARNLKLLMDDKLHSLDIESVIDGFGNEAETCTAGSALVLLSECLRKKHP